MDRPRPHEPAVPVYRYFLFGGANQFRLTPRSLFAQAFASFAGVPLVLAMVGRSTPSSGMFLLALFAVAISLPLAAFVARWAGRTAGQVAGVLTLVGWTIASVVVADLAVLGAAATAIGAILIYGLSELPNRTAPIPRTTSAVAFYLCTTVFCLLVGLAPLAAVAAVCLGTVVGNQNSRGIRFFLVPAGVAVMLAGATIGLLARATADSGSLALWLRSFESEAPQWGLVGCFAVGAGFAWGCLQTGHGASPWGRLLFSWLFGPAMVAMVGAIPTTLAVTITMPAWAALAGPVAVDLWRGCRSGRRPGWLSPFQPSVGRSRQPVREPT